jgi:hypothetical protein
VEWFKPYDVLPLMDGRNPPAPGMSGISVDSLGRVWVSVRIPRSDWKRYVTPYFDPNLRQNAVKPTSVDAIWATVVEVSDPRTAKVIASTRMNGLNLGFAAPNSLAMYSTDDLGRATIAIVRLALTPRSRIEK